MTAHDNQGEFVGKVMTDDDEPGSALTRQAIRNADGEVIAATCVREPLTEAEHSALVEVVEAARRRFAERDADGSLSAKQEQARQRNRERLERLGMARGVA